MSTKSHGHHHSSHASHDSNAAVAERPAEQRDPANSEDRTKLIEIEAYGLWEQAGKPGGDAAQERFWSEAEKRIVASQTKDK